MSWCPSWSNSLWQGWSSGLVHCPAGNATEPIWTVLASSDGISSWTLLKPQHSNPNPNRLANQLWSIDFLTPPTPLIIPHRLRAFVESLMLLKNSCSIHARWSKSSLKHSIRFCGIFPSLKQNSIAYRSSKVSSRPDYIFEIHQLWQSGFSRMYSNYFCSCLFEPEIIKIGQSSRKMYSNNMNFQESTTILNVCTKKSGNLLNTPRMCASVCVWASVCVCERACVCVCLCVSPFLFCFFFSLLLCLFSQYLEIDWLIDIFSIYIFYKVVRPSISIASAFFFFFFFFIISLFSCSFSFSLSFFSFFAFFITLHSSLSFFFMNISYSFFPSSFPLPLSLFFFLLYLSAIFLSSSFSVSLSSFFLFSSFCLYLPSFFLFLLFLSLLFSNFF